MSRFDKSLYLNSKNEARCPNLDQLIFDLRECGGSVIELLEKAAPADTLGQARVHFCIEEALGDIVNEDYLRMWQRLLQTHDRAKMRIGVEKIINEWQNGGSPKNIQLIGKNIMPEIFGAGLSQSGKVDAGTKVEELSRMLDGAEEEE